VGLLGPAALGVRPASLGLRAHPNRRVVGVPGSRGTELAAALVFLAAYVVSVVVRNALSSPGYPDNPGRWAVLLDTW